MKANRYMLLIGVLFITGLFALSSVDQAFSFPLFRPVVVTFGDSNEVQTSVNTLIADFPQAVVIKYQDINSLQGSLTLKRSHSPLVIVGHGSNQGILGPNNNIISWKTIGSWINTLPSTYVFFLACNSKVAGQYVDVKNMGYPGTVDAVLGAITAAVALQRAYSNTNAIQHLEKQFMARVDVIQQDTANILPLACAMSIGPAPSVISPKPSIGVSNPSLVAPSVVICGGGGGGGGGSTPPPTYSVTFTESGLGSGLTWSVNLNGVTKSSSSSTITFSGLNSGTYSFSIGNVIDTSVPINDIYYIGTSSGSVSVSNNVNKAVSFTGPYVKGYKYLSPGEALWDSETLMVDLFLGLLPASGVVSGLKEVIWEAVAMVGLKMVLPIGLNIFDGLILGLPFDQILLNIAGSLSALLTIVINAIENYPWSLMDALIINTITIATFLLWQASGDVALALQLAIVLALEAIDINRLFTDYYDTDLTPAW